MLGLGERCRLHQWFHIRWHASERWSQAEEPWFHGFWYYLYSDQYQKAINIDTNSKTVLLGGVPPAHPWQQPITHSTSWRKLPSPANGISTERAASSTSGRRRPHGRDICVSMIEQPSGAQEHNERRRADLTIEMGRTNLIASRAAPSTPSSIARSATRATTPVTSAASATA